MQNISIFEKIFFIWFGTTMYIIGVILRIITGGRSKA